MNRVVAAAFILLWISPALAQVTSTPAPPSSAPVSPPTASANLQRAAPGDHWTYQVRDEISGAIKTMRTVIVTDVSATEIATRFEIAETGRSGNILYDHSWNVMRDAMYKYSPNDGSGIHLPLTQNTKWRFSSEAVDANNGAVWKRVGSSQVTGMEAITTKAGAFEAFVVQTDYSARNVKDPTRSSEVSLRTWFSPAVNHWIKRNTVLRQEGRVFQNETIELTAYGRKDSD
jgi:hypothetical protein